MNSRATDGVYGSKGEFETGRRGKIGERNLKTLSSDDLRRRNTDL
jgi:hypothetical protein